MKKINFVANHQDNMHCVMAAFRMVHLYYFEKDLTWQQIDKIAHTEKGRGSWTFPIELDFAKKGLKILNIEPVDYGKLSSEGVDYLKQVVGEKTANYYLDKTNVASLLNLIPEYVANVDHESRRATTHEIVRHIKAGFLVQAEVNVSILDNYKGFDLHTTLIFDFDGKNFIAHDPGLPPKPNRKISIEEFKKCFEYKGASQAIVVFKGLKKV